METGRTQLMGGGLIVAPSSKMKSAVVVEGEGGEGREEGREKRLLKVMREKEQLRQTNSQLQKNLTELPSLPPPLVPCLSFSLSLSLSLQLKKVIGKSSALPGSTIAWTPSATSASMEQIEEEKTEGENEAGGSRVIPLYVQVDKSKVRNYDFKILLFFYFCRRRITHLPHCLRLPPLTPLTPHTPHRGTTPRV